MVAVVGPNGCGKSNIIDAVRWVLGELSAKNLRGESMADVIFNGSELRKASGQCSIELLFDNSMGKLGGEYSKYNEISVKRVMTRDGQSNYFINKAKVRRKDVQDKEARESLQLSSLRLHRRTAQSYSWVAVQPPLRQLPTLSLIHI